MNWYKVTCASLAFLGLIGGLSYSPASAAPATSAKPISIILDDVPLPLSVPPLIRNNVTLVPFRAIGSALGISVTWNSANQEVRAESIVNGVNKEITLKIGSKSARVNGQAVSLLAAPVLLSRQVFIPLNFFGTQFGSKVGWNASANAVTIVSPKRAMHLRSFYALGSFQQRDRIADLNSVVFGWSRIDEDGHFTTEGEEYDWPKAADDITPESLVRDASANGIKPYLMVYSLDGQHELTKMLSDQTLRQAALDGIVGKVADAGFKGVVLDFEGLGWKEDPIAQQSLLNSFAKELSGKLHALGATLSLAVPPPNSAYKGYDYKMLASVAEDLIVMAYGYHPKGTPLRTPEPNAQVDQAINALLAAGVDRNKIVLDISLASETTESVDDKVGLAKRYGLKGAAFWFIKIYSQAYADVIDQSVVKTEVAK